MAELTKTVDVRLLVNAEVDTEWLVESLIKQTSGPGAPLGAMELLCTDVDKILRLPTGTAVTRPNVQWDGDAR